MHSSSLSHTVKPALLSLLLLAGAWTLSVYMRLEPVPLFRLLLTAAALLSLRTLSRRPLRRRESAVFALFSAAVSLVLVLGFHIHMEDRYHGTVLSNYITPYALTDALAFLVMIPVLTVLFSALYRIITAPKSASPAASGIAPVHRRLRLIVFAALMVCYLPYLIVYWPGLVLNDTLSSISQALEMTPLVNHHPVLYTLFIRLCMAIGEALLHSRTAGYALYTLSQMLYVSACLAYLIDWVSRHVRRSGIAAAAMTALFGLVPYFASYSVAGWKDPVFSVSVAVLSVMLLDDVIHSKKALPPPPAPLQRIGACCS